MNRAVFLDRDGVLIEEKNYLHRVEDVAIFPGVSQALKRFQDAGYLLFIVTNQSGVGRGYFTLAEVDKVHTYLTAEWAKVGIQITRIYVAPEAPDQPSRGRKPSPQFLFDARDDFQVDLGRSFLVGDKLVDLECGWNAGIGLSFLVRTGYGSQVEKTQAGALQRAVIVDDLASVADYLLGAPAEKTQLNCP
jgi:D-glycero-D-manno-heptose 1,7-bisphosphate phosphatase